MIKPPPAPTESIRISRRNDVAARLTVSTEKSFYHSGDMGDIIYSLPFVKSVGGGTFYVGPDTQWPTNSKADSQRYEFLLPLLKAQPYIRKATYLEKRPDSLTYDLNRFREVWFENQGKPRKGVSRLFEAYAVRFGKPQVNEKEPWLTVPDPIAFKDKPVIIHRSFRYRNDAFPWAEVVRRYAYRMVFIGQKFEYEEWSRPFGEVASFYEVQDALEMARVIAGSRLFIGNQSFPNSLALGLGVNVIQEACVDSPDCKLNRPSVQCFGHCSIQWPDFGRRYVAPCNLHNGLHELGPCENAHGLGDTLTIVPLIRSLRGKAVLKLPIEMVDLAPLFTNVCPVMFTDDYPEFRHESNKGTWKMAESKLRLFGCWPEDILPSIEITVEEARWAKEKLSAYKNPIAFVPTCAQRWAHIRQKSPEFWIEHIQYLSRSNSVLQFGLSGYPTVPGVAERVKGFTIRQIAALYSEIKRYVGIDTGDMHLMLAVGGEIDVYHPDPQSGYNPFEFSYDSPRARYHNFRELKNGENNFDPCI